MPRSLYHGGFVWTGFDYRGESTPFYRWPNVSSQFGIMDSCGFAKRQLLLLPGVVGQGACAAPLPALELQPGQTVNVWCYSNLDSIELFVNGRSQGVRKMEPYGHVEWDVTFEPGMIEARGYKDGKLVLTDKRETTGVPAQILLTGPPAIDADGEDVAVVTVATVDAQGRVVRRRTTK